MHKIINAEKTNDYVVATGHSHSVRQLCDYVFSKLGLDYKNYVVQNPKFFRPQELKYLKGDSSKIRNELGWKPTYTFETLLDDMLNHWKSIFECK